MLKLSKTILLAMLLFSAGGFFRNESGGQPEPNSNKIEVKVSEKEVDTGQVFSYLIKIKGDFEDPVIKKPCLDNFKIVSTQRSQSFFYQESKTKIKIEITYLLLAPEAGVFIIGPVEVSDQEKTYQSEKVEIKVTGEPLKKKPRPKPPIGEGIEI